MTRPLRLAIVDDYAVVVAGVASFLEVERIDVVETGRRRAPEDREALDRGREAAGVPRVGPRL